MKKIVLHTILCFSLLLLVPFRGDSNDLNYYNYFFLLLSDLFYMEIKGIIFFVLICVSFLNSIFKNLFYRKVLIFLPILLLLLYILYFEFIANGIHYQLSFLLVLHLLILSYFVNIIYRAFKH